MQPSTSLCRTQEARQHALARTTTLDNVRSVATAAAAAWAKEGVASKLREDRKLRSSAIANIAAELQPSLDSLLSENPDRGQADARL